MKIRQGFVSNSSSTSFCMYGVYLTRDQLDAILKYHNLEVTGDGSGEDCELLLKRDSGRNDGHLGYWTGPDGDDGVYIGESWPNMRDDETKKQFQARIELGIQALGGTAGLPEKIVCATHEESWRDG